MIFGMRITRAASKRERERERESGTKGDAYGRLMNVNYMREADDEGPRDPRRPPPRLSEIVTRT